MTITVRRVEAGDIEVFRRVRLGALQESPSAFGSTFAAESQMSDDEWAARTAAWATAEDRAMFLARHGADVVGLVGVLTDEQGPQLISMWTAPEARRRGVGRMLVEAALDWSRDSGAPAVELWVTTGNEPAQTLYESMGFVVTGEHQPLPSDPCKDETRMRCNLLSPSSDRRV